MKLNTAWLLKYLATPIPHREMVDAMPRAALEVEAESELKVALEPIRIGFVREKSPIAGAAGMFSTRIEIEHNVFITVLVGSDHEVEVGWGVPVAVAGTVLPTGKKVSAGKFHGIDSSGMICLDGELGLIARDSGMHHWVDPAMLGKRFVDLVEVPEFLIELKVLPNRPDCLGLLGISREIAAIFGVKTDWPTYSVPAPAGGTPIAAEIAEPALCRRLTVAPFDHVKVGPSPAWLKSVLLTAGMRPINNVVDITNFVMYETGQPMHAFDLAKLAGPKLVARKLAAGESLELLSGKTLDTKYGNPLVIADAEKPQALAGIMGGKLAETTEATTRVALEVAYFDPVHVRGNVKALRKLDGSGGTDASYRFERGVDPNAMLDWARGRAYALIGELAGGNLAAVPTNVYPESVKPKVFKITAERVSRIIGRKVSGDEIISALRSLGYEVNADLMVTVPTFRVDVNDPVVLAEDVARMIGYDNIAAADRPSHATLGQTCAADKLRQALANALASVGYYETKNDPLEADTRTAKWLGEPDPAIVLNNAATAEMNTLRRTLLTGLSASAQRNVFRNATRIRLFEIDRTFGKLPGNWTLGGVAGGAAELSTWRAPGIVDFFTVKGELQDLFQNLRLPAPTFTPARHAPLRDGHTAEIKIGEAVIGHLGELDPKTIKIDRLAYKLIAFEFDLTILESLFGQATTYTATIKLPPAVRDLAIVLPIMTPYAKIEQLIRNIGGPQLEQLDLVDDYRGPPVPQGRRSLAMRLTFRDSARTLTAEEVASTIDAIIRQLKAELDADLRA